ncbi:MAG: permease prefix domain 1-containing protein [Dehalococcoidia bacterium]
MNHDDAIEMFLDDLAARLRGDGVHNRRILREVEEHLLDDVEGLIDSGVERDMARRMAVERFGTPSEIALDFDSGLPRRERIISASASLARYCVLLAGIVFVAIGVSGVIAFVLGETVGISFVADPVVAGSVSDDRCVDFFGFHPEVATCEEAALLHHYDELIGYRLAAGALGLLAIAVAWATGVRGPVVRRLIALPPTILPAMVAGLFAVTTFLALFIAVMEGAFVGSDGSGEMLSNALTGMIFFVLSFGAFLISTDRGSVVRRWAVGR